ncbi:branched-chain amino acid transaminase [Streptomyces sp. NBC_01217]|uniref:branched-chain amino acid transaminase n=1 Tax=Streptomyces sp. NBC_01217 TaxID=2903779 RepID=UPI002E161817|nr:branched-chain amino acid transaminase [Streptomyces sp. NBC_01217]
MTAKSIWLDGEIVAWEDANVHVSVLGLHYGIGFFEGIRCHRTSRGTVAFRLTDHLDRLARSAAVYGVSLPYSVDELTRACAEVVAANGLGDCYLRPIVFLGDGPNPLAAPFHAAVIPSAHGPLAGEAPTQGVTAQISSFRRMSANSLPPAAKATGQYLNAFLAQSEAVRSGYHEAILLNGDGHVADGWVHNLFTVRGGVLSTPPTTSGALGGITRDSVMTLAAARGVAVREENLVRSDLYLADECFLTGTAAGVVPVVSVDGRTIGAGVPGELTTALTEDLRGAVHGSGYPDWLKELP